jgi:hypothetical protein
MSPVARDRGVFVGMMALEDDARVDFAGCVRIARRCSPAWKVTISMR